MAQNKVQYQRGLSMSEFFDRYGSQQQCEALVQAWRWPQGFVCPSCKDGCHSELCQQGRFYFQCSLVSGTVFESSKLALPKWFLSMHLMTQAKNNVSALELKRHLGVSYPTAWLLKQKIMQVMVDREQWRQLTGRVEIDESKGPIRLDLTSRTCHPQCHASSSPHSSPRFPPTRRSAGT